MINNVKKFNKSIKQTMDLDLDKIAITAPRQHGSTHALLQMAYERSNDDNRILVLSGETRQALSLREAYCDRYHKFDRQPSNVEFSTHQWVIHALRHKYKPVHATEIYIDCAGYCNLTEDDIKLLANYPGRVVLSNSTETTYYPSVNNHHYSIDPKRDKDLAKYHKRLRKAGFSVFEFVN